jgi:GLPGLI family protein
MKKAIRIFPFLLVIFFFGSVMSFAGKPFEGIITFKITYPDSKYTESQMAMFPKLLTVTIKGSKSKTEISIQGGSQVEIIDYTDKTKIALINMMGQKYAIKQTTEEINKEMEKDPKGTVELSSETRTIAGYTCKKATVTVDEDGAKTTYEVWYSSELGSKETNFDKGTYKDIDGVMLEYTMVTPQITMKFTATSVEKKGISAKDFEIPADYTITTMDELKSKFGGME